MQIEIEGIHPESEKCRLSYKSKIIYFGYIDDLMTSNNGSLQLNLNYGGEKTTIVNIKRFIDKYFWIPIWTNNYNIKPLVILSLEEMEYIWNKLGYDFADEEKYIKMMNHNDMKLFWMLNSGLVQGPEIQVNRLSKIIQKKNIAASHDGNDTIYKVFLRLLHDNWNNLELNHSTVEKDGFLISENLIIYLELEPNDIKWIPLAMNKDGKILINLNDESHLKVNYL